MAHQEIIARHMTRATPLVSTDRRCGRFSSKPMQTDADLCTDTCLELDEESERADHIHHMKILYLYCPQIFGNE